MFYCDECAEKKALAKTFFKSYGACELCKQTKECNDSGKQDSSIKEEAKK